jgi:putative membrane protein
VEVYRDEEAVKSSEKASASCRNGGRSKSHLKTSLPASPRKAHEEVPPRNRQHFGIAAGDCAGSCSGKADGNGFLGWGRNSEIDDRTMARPAIAGAKQMILQSLTGLPAFLAYFCTAFVIVIIYLIVYTRITPHDEFTLIRNNVPGAAIALGLSLLGFALPVASVIAHTENLIDCMIWSLIALIVQVIVYFVVRIPIPNLPQRIAAGDLAPAIWLGLASLAAGALSAASISY